MRISDWSSDVCSSDLQTAAALSQMGGTVGRVASFMAGPWGAAIIGFTMLIGLMIGKTKEAKDATVDLTDAEARRAATRSEEHTSGLQSLIRISYAVFFLKKKTKLHKCNYRTVSQ